MKGDVCVYVVTKYVHDVLNILGSEYPVPFTDSDLWGMIMTSY